MGNEAHSAFGYVRSELHRPSPCTDGKAVVPIQFEADETNCRGESDKAELSSTMRRNITLCEGGLCSPREDAVKCASYIV
jgi:hypothetical protein